MIEVGKTYNRWTVLVKAPSRRSPGGQSRAYWTCECSCGAVKSVYSHSLLSGKSVSCGCYKSRQKLPPGVSAMRNRLASYRSRAKKLNLIFDLSESQFEVLTKSSCFYCDSSPSNTAKGYKDRGSYNYSGIDRVDNDLGYTLSNVVAACKNCNKAKLDLSQPQFFSLVRKIYEKHLK